MLSILEFSKAISRFRRPHMLNIDFKTEIINEGVFLKFIMSGD